MKILISLKAYREAETKFLDKKRNNKKNSKSIKFYQRIIYNEIKKSIENDPTHVQKKNKK